jgi:predicted lipid carrier protein YhbT
LHIHCTDVAGEWLVVPDGEGFALTREHAKGDAAIRGAAADVLLALWGRRGVAAALGGAELDVVGDASVAEAWLSIGGV